MSKTIVIRTLSTTYGVIATLLFAVVSGDAQQEERHFTFNAGAGFSPLVGQISDRLNNGWNITVGAGYRFTRHFETNLQFTYNGFGVKPLVLQEAGVPSANSHLWSLTIDPKLRVHSIGRVVPYFTGGVGYYRRTIQFTQPTVAPIDIFDPFFGFFFFPTLVPANIVLGKCHSWRRRRKFGCGIRYSIRGRHPSLYRSEISVRQYRKHSNEDDSAHTWSAVVTYPP
jgi:hypothetical protein